MEFWREIQTVIFHGLFTRFRGTAASAGSGLPVPMMCAICFTLRGATFHQGRIRGLRMDLGSSLGKGATTPSMMMAKAMMVAKMTNPIVTFILECLKIVTVKSWYSVQIFCVLQYNIIFDENNVVNKNVNFYCFQMKALWLAVESLMKMFSNDNALN